jgi:hypothetical protein
MSRAGTMLLMLLASCARPIPPKAPPPCAPGDAIPMARYVEYRCACEGERCEWVCIGCGP